MLESVEISEFRGIARARLDGLTRLSVLVGPSGGGKSTVLDALFVGAHPWPAQALAQVVERRPEIWRGAAWIVRAFGTPEFARLVVRAAGGAERASRLVRREHVEDEEQQIVGKTRRMREPLEAIDVLLEKDRQKQDTPLIKAGTVLCGANDEVLADTGGASPLLEGGVLLVDAGVAAAKPLDEVYSRAVQLGRRPAAFNVAKALVPGLQAVEILTESGTPVLHLVYEHGSVPAEAAGDGVRRVLRIGLELAAAAGGTALLEDPEVHQHPGAVRQTAQAIVEASRRDVQVILTTHSLELIDGLLALLSPEELPLLSVFRLRLPSDGVLQFSRIDGADVALARNEIGDDLR